MNEMMSRGSSFKLNHELEFAKCRPGSKGSRWWIPIVGSFRFITKEISAATIAKIWDTVGGQEIAFLCICVFFIVRCPFSTFKDSVSLDLRTAQSCVGLRLRTVLTASLILTWMNSFAVAVVDSIAKVYKRVSFPGSNSRKTFRTLIFQLVML